MSYWKCFTVQHHWPNLLAFLLCYDIDWLIDLDFIFHIDWRLHCQWTISEVACYTYSLVVVPLYDTLGTESIGYIIEKGREKRHRDNEPCHPHSSLRTPNSPTNCFHSVILILIIVAPFFPGSISTIICDVAQKAQIILECVSGKGKTVKTIVLMEAFDAELVSRGQECGVEIISLADFEVRNRPFWPCFTYIQR